MGHSYNHGVVTSLKGMALEAVRITGMNTSPCTVAEQLGSGFVKSVTIASGLVTVQLNGPYPPRIVTCNAGYSTASTTTDIFHARYITNSYNSTTGQFQIALSDDDDAGTPIAASPGAADELHLFMVFGRYTGLSH